MQFDFKKAICLLLLIQGTVSCFKINIGNSQKMLEAIRRFLPESPVILESGGHYGEDTVKMKRLWPEAVMHVFEPLPSSFEKMIHATQNLSDVYCYPYALTDHSGSISFYYNSGNTGASSINAPVGFNASEFDKTPLTVSCITLSEWAMVHNVDHIDFMWLDMESHELYALRHGIEILKTVKVIFTEVAYEPVREGSALYPEYKSFLEEQGFQEVGIRSFGRFGDALFIKRELVPQELD